MLRKLLAAMMMIIIMSAAPTVRADDEDDAISFLEKKARVKSFIEVMQFGAKPGTGKAIARIDIVDNNGRKIPNQFGIRMRYTWEGIITTNGQTDVDFYFDGNGKLSNFRPIRNNGLVAPFDGANVLLEVTKAAVRRMAKNTKDEQAVNNFVDNTKDMKSLTLGLLKLEQALGR